MQSRIEHGHGYSEDQLNASIERPAAREEHGVVEHDLHDNEKKSVLKKVKAKAKKLKDTIKKHTPGGGGHDHDEHEDQLDHHEYDQGQHKYHEEEEDDEDREDEEREKEPEVHGAPMYDMESAKSFVPGQVGTSVQHDGAVKFGGSPTERADTDQRLKAGEERPFAPVNTPVDVAYPTTTHHEYTPPKASPTTTIYPSTTDYPGAESTNVAGAGHDPIGAAFAETHNHGPTAAGTRHDPMIATSHAPAIRTDAAGTHHAPTTAGTHHALNVATSAGSHHVPIAPGTPITAASQGTTHPASLAAGTRHDPMMATSHAPTIGTSTGIQHTPPIMSTHQDSTTTGKHDAPTIGTSTGIQHTLPIMSTHQDSTTTGKHDAPTIDISTSAGTHHAPPIMSTHQDSTTTGKHDAPTTGTSTGIQHTPPIMSTHQDSTTTGKHDTPPIDISTSAGTHHAPTIPASVGAHHVPASARTHREAMGSNQQGVTTIEEDRHGPEAYNKNYQTNVTDPTGRGGEEIGVTPAVIQSLGSMRLHDEQQRQTTRPTQEQEERLFKPTSGHQKETRVVGEGDLEYSAGSHDQFSPEPITTETNSFSQKPEFEQPEFLDTVMTDTGDQRREENIPSEKAADAKDLMASRLAYGSSPDDFTSRKSPEQGDQSYTEKLSSAAGTVAEKAAEAKNVVASKLGYGNPGEPERHKGESAREGHDTTQTAGALGGYGSEGRTNIEGQDKGASVKEYFVDKLTPGEEDKALSQVISESLHKEAQGTEKEDVRGRVAESEEVRRRLGHSSEEKLENEGVGSGGGNSPGRTMVDQIKGAMTDWFGKGGETQPSKGFHDVSKG